MRRFLVVMLGFVAALSATVRVECGPYREGPYLKSVEGYGARMNVNYGYIDKTGKMVIPAKFEWVEPFHEGLAVFGKSSELYVLEPDAYEWLPVSKIAELLNGKYGYIDKAGKTVIPAKFDLARKFSEGLAAATNNYIETGFIDKTGEFVIKPQYVRVGDFSDGMARVTFEELPQKWGFIDKTGKMIIEPQYINAGDFSDGLAPVMTGNLLTGKWGYIDKSGKTVIEPQFYDANPFSEGLALVRLSPLLEEISDLGGIKKWAYIDKKGNVVIGPKEGLHASDFSDGLAWIRNLSETEYMDKRGNIVINHDDSLLNKVYIEGDFHEDLVPVSFGERVAFVDKTGKVVLSPLPYKHVSEFSEGLAVATVSAKKGGKYGYIDKAGKLITKQKFDKVDVASEDLAPVRVGDEMTGKWGFVDKTGKLVIKPQFDMVGRCSEGLIPVGFGDRSVGKWGYVDRTGKMVIKPQFDHAGEFREGLAWISINGKNGYIDHKGEFAIAPTFINTRIPGPDFSDGLAVIGVDITRKELITEKLIEESKYCYSESTLKIGDYMDMPDTSYGYIDKSGKTIIEPRFGSAGSFSEGLSSVEIDGKYGFIDKTGKLVIPAKFADAKDFWNGRALVRIESDDTEVGSAAFIDKTGKAVIPPGFVLPSTSCGYFCDGLMPMMPNTLGDEDLWGYMDENGKTVIKPKFAFAREFSEGLAAVEVDSKWGFIDTTGKTVIKPQYDAVGDFSSGMAGVAWNE